MPYPRLYISEQREWKEEIEKTTISNSELGYKVVSDGFILPLRIQPGRDEKCGCMEGGVCDSSRQFFAGSAEKEQKGFVCNSSYTFVPDEAIISDAHVVYGGVFYHHFGVMLMRSLSRLWWIAKNKKQHVVFLLDPYESGKARKYADEVMHLLGMDCISYSFVEQITQYAEIIVPDEAYSSHYKLNVNILLPYDVLKNRFIDNFSHRKVYLSRGKSRNDGINEVVYESFFRDMGYEVVLFSELSFSNLVRIIANADELAYTYGTIANAAVLFAKNNTKHTCLLRANDVDWWFALHYGLMKLRKVNCYIVEATRNPYPMYHDMGGGAYLYFPTKQFEKYVRDTTDFIDYKSPSKVPLYLIAQYSLLWASKHVYRPSYFKSLGRPELFPLLQQYAKQFLGVKLKEEKYI